MVKLKAIHFFLLLAVINLKVESNNNTARSYEIGVVLKVDLVDGVVLEKCISMAISDFYHLHPYHRTQLRLRSTPQTVMSNTGVVQAILEVTNENQADENGRVPIISLSQDISSEIEAIASTLPRFGSHDAVLVYEDTTYCYKMIPSLVNSLHVPYLTSIPSHAKDFQILNELNLLMMRKARVIILHMMTPSLMLRLLTLAREIGIVESNKTLLLTSTSTNSLNDSVIESMEGVWGIRSHVTKSNNTHLIGYPNIFYMWTYDSIWALAMEIEKANSLSTNLVQEMLNVNFKGGLSGNFQLVDGQLKCEEFEIFNVIGKRYKVLGYLSAKKEIYRKSLVENSVKMSTTWCEYPNVPKYLRIGVPVTTGFKEFVNRRKNIQTNKSHYFGFSIDVFLAALRETELDNISYEFLPFENDKGEMNGSYDDLLLQIPKQTYDIVVGDITIVANRTKYVDFTLPYSDPGFSMLVAVKHGKDRGMWTFTKPWSWDLWLAAFSSFIFMGVVLRIMEHQTLSTTFAGPPNRQLGMTLLWSFTAIAFPHREIVVKDWSRFVLVIWIGFAVILMQIYTASLSSMLTVNQLEPQFHDIKEIKTRKYKVGYQRLSFAKGYLMEQLNFSESQLVPLDSEGYRRALFQGGVVAIFDEIPYIKVFLAKHGSNYMMTGPLYQTNGFGFAFPKNSALVQKFSNAIIKVRENRKVMDAIGKKYFRQKSESVGVSSQIPRKLHASSLAGLFIIVGVATMFALLISEKYIWTKLIQFTKQYTNKYFSSHHSSIETESSSTNYDENTHHVDDSDASLGGVELQVNDDENNG